jgi:hypothetical protein
MGNKPAKKMPGCNLFKINILRAVILKDCAVVIHRLSGLAYLRPNNKTHA